MVFLPLATFGNPAVLGMSIGESDQAFVESKYVIVHQAVISNVRKTVYEIAEDQVDSDSLFTQNELLETAVYFNDRSILSDVHLVYENWEFSKAIDALDAHFERTSETYPAYGNRAVVYSWPDYSVVCFTDPDSGFTHIIFASLVSE